MPSREPWTERKFDFDFPSDRYPELLTRLREAPARMESLTTNLPPGVLVRRDGDAWSILENVGHLGDLEELWARRLTDYEKGAAELRPADMSNRVTYLADHNSHSLDDLTGDFRTRRAALLKRLESLKPDDFAKVAYHGRLDAQMRLCDTLYFVAEHDDHHLETIRLLAESPV